MRPLDEIYKIPSDEFGVAEKYTCQGMVDIKWFWITDYFWKIKWENQVAEAQGLCGPTNVHDITFSIFGGIQIPRSFLDRYAHMNPAPLINDEARIGLYAHCLGFKMTNIALADVNASGDYAGLMDEMFMNQIESGSVALHPVRTVRLMRKVLRKIGAQ